MGIDTESQDFFPAGVDAKLFPINRRRYDVLARIVRYFPVPYLRVLEVGSFVGQSALHWSTQIAEHCAEGGIVLCVDPWKPFLSELDVNSSGALYQQTQASLEDGSAFRQFKKNIEKAPAKAPIEFFRKTLTEAKEVFDTTHILSFDIVYIDGSHYYEDVKRDLALAKSLVRDGGILCGDDLERQFDTVDQDATLQECKYQHDFIGFHPGVTLAVWVAFGRVWAEHGVWAMRHVVVSENQWQFPEGV